MLSSYAVTPLAHQFYEVIVGFGIAGTGFGVILAVVGRASSDDNRSMSLAIAAAAGSSGQVFGPPLAEYLLNFMGWQTVFMIFAVLILSVLLTLPLMRTAGAGKQADARRKPGPCPEESVPGSVLHAHFPGVLQLRLSVGVHHRPFSGFRDRGLRPD